jgi:hypothetical protein
MYNKNIINSNQKGTSLILHNSDPLSMFLINFLGLNPYILSFTILIFNIGVHFCLTFYFNIFYSSSSVIGIIDQWYGVVVYDLLITPFVIGFYLWMPSGISQAFNKIKDSSILIISKKEKKKIFDPTNGIIVRIFNNPYLFYITLIIVVFVSIQQSIIQIRIHNRQSVLPVTWLQSNMIFFFSLKLPIWILGWYSITMIIFREILVIWGFRKLFKGPKPVKIYALHPDGCGGLKPLSDYIIRFALLIATVGIGLGVLISGHYIYSGHYLLNIEGIALLIALVAYLFLTPILFFAPLGTAHASMKNAKEHLLNKISNEFQKQYDLFQENLTKNITKTELVVKRIVELRELHNVTMLFPVWPFNLSNIKKFIATITAPLIPPLISVIFELLRKLLSL